MFGWCSDSAARRGLVCGACAAGERDDSAPAVTPHRSPCAKVVVGCERSPQADKLGVTGSRERWKQDGNARCHSESKRLAVRRTE